MASQVDILVVEDSLTQALQLKTTLNALGFTVIRASDGRQALAVLRQHHPTFVLSDIVMPGMDGYQLCRHIKDDPELREISVILMTTLTDTQEVTRALESKADGFITKPCEESFLRSRIEAVLANRRFRAQTSTNGAVQVMFEGTPYTLTSEPTQMIDLLLSTFANAVQKNRELEQAYQAQEQSHRAVQQLNRQLKNSEANYQSLLQSHPDGIVVVDLDNNVQFVNAVAEVMLQKPAEALIHTKLDFPLVMNEVGEVSVLGTASELIIAEIRANETVWEGAAAKLVTFSDINTRKNIEETLRRAKEEAEALTQAKAEILATMSHELRTPLNGIIGMADLLFLTPLTEEQEDFAKRVKTNAQSLLNMVNQTLDLSKIEAKKFTLDDIDFDLHTTLDSVTEIFTKDCADKSLELTIVTNHDVPSCLSGDPGRLRQVLTNLIGNAVKFTEKGEVVVRVSVVEETESWVLLHFAVSDTGIGVPADRMDRLFHSFSQADTSLTRRYGGTGLGLAISKQLVELMSGEIGVDSELGKGSIFWFTARFEKRPAKVAALEPETSSLRGIRVLIVEENLTTYTSLASHFASWGITCASATSAAQALGLLSTAAKTAHPFQIAVVDWYLPDMDGVAFARAVRAQAALHEVRLVMLTSVGQRGDGLQAREVGIQAYLTKPLRRSQLFKCLRTVLAQPTIMSEAQPPPALVTRYTLAEAESTPCILVVDDNIDNQTVAVRLLKNLGYRADVASDGEEAWAALKTRSYVAVLMDCQMPGIDGFTTTEQIRNQERETGTHIPIIAFTADPTENNRQRCFQVGMDGFIAKPLQQTDLEAILKHWTSPPVPETDPVIGQAWPPPQLSHQRSRILIVEDNDTGQKIAVKLLQSLGYHEIDVVSSGREALKAIACHRYAIVLMDYQLPEMNGVTTTAYIREHDRHHGTHTPIIAFTARVSESTREKFMAVGMDGYIAKPIDRGELKATVARWLGNPPEHEPPHPSVVDETETMAEGIETHDPQ